MTILSLSKHRFIASFITREGSISPIGKHIFSIEQPKFTSSIGPNRGQFTACFIDDIKGEVFGAVAFGESYISVRIDILDQENNLMRRYTYQNVTPLLIEQDTLTYDVHEEYMTFEGKKTKDNGLKFYGNYMYSGLAIETISKKDSEEA